MELEFGNVDLRGKGKIRVKLLNTNARLKKGLILVAFCFVFGLGFILGFEYT